MYDLVLKEGMWHEIAFSEGKRRRSFFQVAVSGWEKQRNGYRISPVNIQKAYRKGDVAELDRLMADLCVGCGICSYVCPAKQPLTQSVGLAGKLLKAEKRKAKGRG